MFLPYKQCKNSVYKGKHKFYEFLLKNACFWVPQKVHFAVFRDPEKCKKKFPIFAT